MKPLAIVQHQPSVPPGVIGDVIAERNRSHVVIQAWRDVTWPRTEDVSALVVLGGTMNVDQLGEYPFLKQSRDLMSDAIDKAVPVLGVCLGAQMLARVLGAEVKRAPCRNALFSRIELTADGSRDPLTKPFGDVDVLQFHEDTFVVPADCVPLATSVSNGLAQAFRYNNSAYAIQFHFEVDRKIVERWVHNIGRRSMLDDWGIAADEFLRAGEAHLVAQRAAGAELVRRFLDLTS